MPHGALTLNWRGMAEANRGAIIAQTSKRPMRRSGRCAAAADVPQSRRRSRTLCDSLKLRVDELSEHLVKLVARHTHHLRET